MKNKKNKEIKEKSLDLNQNDVDKNKKRLKKRSWIVRGSIIVVALAIIAAIFGGIYAPKTRVLNNIQGITSTSQYVKYENSQGNDITPTSLQNDLILNEGSNNYLVITSSQLSNATVNLNANYGGKRLTYLVYIPNSNIGQIEFSFTVGYNDNGPIWVQIGNVASDMIKLPNFTDSSGASLLAKTIKLQSIDKSTSHDTSSSDNGSSQLTNSYTSLNDWINTLKNNEQYSEAVFFENIYTKASQLVITSNGFDWGALVDILYIIFIFGFFGIMIYSMMRGGAGAMAGGDIFSMGKSQAKLASSKVRFSDVGGIGEEKYELQEIVDFLKQPKKYASMGARVPKGVILYGPPGTGKTLLAKAVAGEANVPFLETSGSSFEDMLVGVGAKRVRDMFQRAKKSAPAIIFIDEIDSVAGKRNNNRMGDSGLANQTINELLSQMDGFNTSSGVIVIAATNRLDMLDEAILRPGRFDRQIPVNLPDINERVEILKIHARNKNISSKVSLEDVARRTPGFSGAQLENVLNEAALMAVRHNSNTISLGDIDEAIDRVVGGPAKHNRKVSFEEKKQIAFHEAGHALVGLNVEGSDIVEKITIVPRGQAAGYTIQTPAIQELQIQKKSDLLGLIASTLGGRASEEIIFGKDAISTGASNDLYKATNIAKAMVAKLGMTDVGMMQYIPTEGEQNPYRNDYSEKTAEAIDQKINAILNERYNFAKNILVNNRRELELIVESLLILETIDRKQIEFIHKEKKNDINKFKKKKAIKL